MKQEPGAILQTKSTTMLICRDCIKSDVVQSMVNEKKATLIYSVPTLEEERNNV